MEDFVEIIFYVVILVLSGIGSLLKNKKKQQKKHSPAPMFPDNADEFQTEMRQDVFDVPKNPAMSTTTTTLDSDVVVENDLERMFREVAEMAEVKKREEEELQRQQREEELRQIEIAEQKKKAELIRAEKAKELAKRQKKTQNKNFGVADDESTLDFALNFSDIDEVRRAFIASEIFNRKY